MVYYRKYRPQKISDLDSTVVREKLLSVFGKGDSIPHAFLFTGPKGLGKTSTARIVAKAVNCEKQQLTINNSQLTENKKESSVKSQLSTVSKGEPCNKCESCISITNGTNLDVLEIDAASNRGIDEIRDLKEKIRLSPVAAKKKVYIIDEVHMLTTEAFNALLKMLEEPPPHAMFVLCTTEPHKVLPTIISRCFHIHFNLATGEEIVHSLKRIVRAENLQIDDDVLYAIARMAEGGFRDGTKILEELSLFAKGEKITKDLFEQSYMIAGTHLRVIDLLEALKNKDTKKALETVGALVSQGLDIKFFITQILLDLHKKLLSKLGIDHGKGVESSINLELEIDEIKELVALFSKAHQETKISVLPQLPLELAIIEYTTYVIPSDHREPRNLTPQRPNSSMVVGDPSASLGMTNRGDVAPGEVTVSSLRKKVGAIQKNKALYGDSNTDVEVRQEIETTTVELMKAPADGEFTKEWKELFWKSVISEVKQHNYSIAGVLRSCEIRSYDNQNLIIETAYTFHKERLSDMKTKEILAKVCKILTGNDIKIGVELKNNS